MTERKTQNIPDAQRKHPRMQLSLDPLAYRILKEIENASRHVSGLVIREWRKRGTRGQDQG